MPRVATKRFVTVIVAAVPFAVATCQSTERLRAWDEEAGRVASLARLLPNAEVADVGAGDGGLALSLAARLSPSARVYATEVDPKLLERIRSAAAERRLANVIVVEGAEDDTRLPDECCDAIVLRSVYRHLTQPKAMGASLAQALKPGGRLVVVEFPPVPEIATGGARAGDREVHGVTAATIVSELNEVSLELVRIVPGWNNEGFYAVLMRKPARSAR